MQNQTDDVSGSICMLRQRLDFIEQTNHLGYWELDISRKCVYWSPEMYNIFGLPPQTCIKRNFIREQLCLEDLPLYKRKLQELLQTQSPVECVLRIRRADGRLIYGQFRASVWYDDKYGHISGTLQDVSTLVAVQNELASAKAETDRLSRERSYFFAQASHDVRQPLQALKIFVSLLKEEKLTAAQKNLVEKVNNAADSLGLWMDNLLEYSKLQSGGITPKFSDFNISALLKKLGAEYVVIADTKKLSFKYRGNGCIVCSDSILLERIIRNLLNNAFKYTYDKVLMTWYCQDNTIRVKILNNGEGIVGRDLRNVFNAFYQGRLHRRYGSGLGLSIVKDLTALLNMEISVRSRPNNWTCFELTIPVA